MSTTALIGYIVQALAFAVFIRAILSWFMINPRSGILVSIYQFFYQITEPLLMPLRRIIPSVGAIDITPMIAFILLQIIASALLAQP